VFFLCERRRRRRIPSAMREQPQRTELLRAARRGEESAGSLVSRSPLEGIAFRSPRTTGPCQRQCSGSSTRPPSHWRGPWHVSSRIGVAEQRVPRMAARCQRSCEA
jgi:hypothetical protein